MGIHMLTGANGPFRAEEFHRGLAALVGALPGESVLDLGCGVGRTLPHLVAAVGPSGRVVGLDANERFLDLARSAAGQGVNLVRHEAAGALPFAEATFQRIVCNNVLECVAEPGPFLADCKRVLAPGGRILFGHFDFDSVVLASACLELTRDLVHGYADFKQPWMAAADGQVGRKLPGLLYGQGFAPMTVGAVLFVERSLSGGYAQGLMPDLVAVGRENGLDEKSLRDWRADLERREREDGFFFSIQWMYALCGQD